MAKLLLHILAYLLFISYVFCGGSLQDRRIKKLQIRVRKIYGLLKGIETKKLSCNDTLYTVSQKVDDVNKLVDHLYKGPLLTRMDLSLGYEDNYDNVLLKLPSAMEVCLQTFEGTRVSKKQAEITCLQQILWRYEEPPKERQLRRMKRLFRSYNTNINDTIRLPPKRRVRKEYRALSVAEREKFHAALNALRNKRIDVIAAFAELHKEADDGAHGGPAFLPWHRAFLTSFENALRKIDPDVTLPYWDSTIDHALSNPTNSIIWTKEFLGNAAGEVKSGPFADWVTHNGKLERAYGDEGSLISKNNVENLLSKCDFLDILPITGVPNSRLEGFHNGVHRWVGGDMGFVGSAPYDPVFYLHHCFIDYLWEKFRKRQRSDECGMDPETNYLYDENILAQLTSMGFNDPMFKMEDYTIEDGMDDFWTKVVYRYEDSPSCENNCGGSDVLMCDPITNYCVPKPRFITYTDIQDIPLPGQSATSTLDPSLVFISSTHCDHYLDPDCHDHRSMLAFEEGRQVQPTEELEIIQQMVPKPRGRQFIGGMPDGRGLRTLKEDLETYERKVMAYKPAV